jgi:hypothetical protein
VQEVEVHRVPRPKRQTASHALYSDPVPRPTVQQTNSKRIEPPEIVRARLGARALTRILHLPHRSSA